MTSDDDMQMTSYLLMPFVCTSIRAVSVINRLQLATKESAPKLIGLVGSSNGRV